MYTTITYYRSTYLGQPVADDTKLTQLLTRASDDMDIASLGRIDITEMSAKQLDWLYKATCAQAEGYAQEGLSDASGSVSLGSFSMSGKEASVPGGLNKRAARYLVMAGLSSRAVYCSPSRNLYQLDSGGVIPEQNSMVEE